MKKILIGGLLILGACRAAKVTGNETDQPGITVSGKLFTSLYQQRAAEYKALCFQAYNIAQLRLDEYKPLSNRPRAIITDIDETIFDNSPFEIHQSLLGKGYNQDAWFEWTDKSAADTVPGALSFLKYAASKGVSVFYISNREERERTSTVKNLQRLGFPNADDAHFYPKQTYSGKEPRRQVVASTYEVVMLLGDNLADFSLLFDRKSTDDRSANVQKLSNEFGKRFIILPNPVYGDWESALFNYNYKLTEKQKDSVIKAAVHGY